LRHHVVDIKFKLPDTIDNWVIASVALGEHRSPYSCERADLGQLEDAREVDDKIRSPCHEPQRDGHEGDLKY
jgi:hypothetical protein